jgi:hypothetical protein
MHVVARARFVLARRPWLYWLAVGCLAAIAALAAHDRLAALDAARRDWGETRTVLVATRTLEPGDAPTAHRTDVPLTLLPVGALDTLPEGARVRQRVTQGEVLTDADVSGRAGPASLADPGTVVVGLSDPLSRDLAAGLDVQVVADGLLLSDEATVVAVADDVVFVAVAASDGPSVAAAAQQGLASLLFVP